MTSQAADTRPNIVVLSRDDYNRTRMESPQLLVDPVTRFVALPLRPPDTEDPALVTLASELRPSTILLRNTFGSGAYLDAAAAYELISLAKFNLFAHVCQILGASRLEVNEVREVDDHGEVKGSMKLKGSAAKGSGTLRTDTSKKVAGSINATWVWQSGVGDAERAHAYAVAEHIIGDPVIAGLIQQRRFSGNELSEHTLELNITSEAQRAIKGALEIKSVLGGRFGPAFNATFSSLSEHTEQLILSLQVVFTPPRT